MANKEDLLKEAMDYHHILRCLTTINKTEHAGKMQDFDNRLCQILEDIQPLLAENDKKFIIGPDEDENKSFNIRDKYMRTVVCILQNINDTTAKNDEYLLSVQQFHILKVSIEIITAIGIIPGLLAGVGTDMAKLCPRATEICNEKLTDMQRYRRLKFIVQSLVHLYQNIMFRPAILVQIQSLLAALLQICHAPLMKPLPENVLVKDENAVQDNFIMTVNLYNKLKQDQEYFQCLFHKFLTNCPLSIAMKELMIILGVKAAPKWLKCATRKYLIWQLMQRNGVLSIIAAVCNDVLDLGEHWNTLDTISRLIVTSHGNNPDEYYTSICSQLLDLVRSTHIKHSTIIANCCIVALYEYNPNVCLSKIIKVLYDPLLLNPEIKEKSETSEKDVDECINNLTKCFITIESKFKQLPSKLLLNIAVSLFSLYNNIKQSACALKSKIQSLVLRLLDEEPSRKDLFSAFLGHNSIDKFGNRLISKFGPTGGIEIIGIDNTVKYEEFADSVFDLTCTNETITTELFCYLLNFLSNSIELKDKIETQYLLKTEDDVLENMQKQLAAVKLLSRLANTAAVQKAQTKYLLPIFSLIKSLFHQYVIKKTNLPQEEDCELLYISLMLIKMILSERKQPLHWKAFSDFLGFLKECCSFSNITPQLLLLIQELIKLIESQGRSERKVYQDISWDSKSSNKFDQALKDLADPLLPVRAHGIITLTKLIENGDPSTTMRNTILLQLFKENLKHDDSFIYLAAINGLCALATSYPQTVIETLVQEYIDMPQRVSHEEITAETRIKLGEVLVKVTKALGEMASAYKNILINGFLCGTRDTDSLVRASSLSCLGELCKVLGFRLGNIVVEVLYCINCVVKTDKVSECRRAAVMVCTLLFRGLGKDTLISMSTDLIHLYRSLKYLRDNDEDPVLRLHAQLALEEIDCIVQDFILSPPKLEKRIFILDSP